MDNFMRIEGANSIPSPDMMPEQYDQDGFPITLPAQLAPDLSVIEKLKLWTAPETYNIAEYILEEEDGEKTLNDLGALVVEEYDYDLRSCHNSGWWDQNEDGLKLAKQLREDKYYAGEKVSNVKYPTIAQAAISYAARAYPAIVKESEVVKFKTIGVDKDSTKSRRANRVAQFLNYQIIEQMENWEDDMDRLLVLHSVTGCVFKKIYFDPISRVNKCDILMPATEVVINYWAKSVETAQRITHVLEYTHNQYIENVRAGIFLDIDLTKPDNEADDGTHTFLEQHRWYDLDGDGYEEPYCVTVEEKSRKVARITPRFLYNDVIANENGKVIRIIPVGYFIKFEFMPSFDGGIYGMGWGVLLGPLNHSINTLFNQLIDAGTMASRQSGFIGKGVKLLRDGEAGELRFRRGEWKQVQVYGDDIRKGVYPLPTAEPSAVLFQLLGLLLEASRELAAQSEVLSGNQNTHNVPATSTLALIEQGLKVFSAIYKRVYRSLKKEFKKLHYYNALYITQEEYQNILDDPEADVADLVVKDYDIVPVSTSATISESQKYIKAQAVMELAGRGLNDMEIYMFYLESLEVPNVERFIPEPQPPAPDPQLEILKAELMLRNRELDIKFLETMSQASERREKELKYRAETMKAMAEAENIEAGEQLNLYMAKVDELDKVIATYDQIAMEIMRARGIDIGGIAKDDQGGQGEQSQDFGAGQGAMAGMAGDAGNTGGMGQPM